MAASGLNKAHASVFSFLTDTLIGKELQAGGTESKYNSQNMDLLSAHLSAKPATGGGGIAIVDDSALEPQVESAGEAYHSDQISVYVVREGDTLSQIAQMFSVSVNTIVWANEIKGGVITPGQNLLILPISGIIHKVEKGETIQSIVKKYESDLNEVLSFNNLSLDSKLAIGDELIIPSVDGPTKSTSSKSVSRQVASGYYISPIVGSYRKTQGIHGYNAVDLAVPIGTKIVASAPGKVIVSKNYGYNGGYANYIVISHPNGTQTLYAHLNSTVVAQGMNVERGQLIGYSGNTGNSTGPHLHYEVRGAKNPGVDASWAK